MHAVWSEAVASVASVTCLREQPVAVLVITLLIIAVTKRLLTGSRSSGKPSDKGVKTAPEVPYWLPVLGHIPQMAFNSDGFLSGLRKAYPGGAFSLNFLGGVHTFLFRPGLSAALINKPVKVADADSVSKHLMISTFGWPKADSEAYDNMLGHLLQCYKKLLTEPSLGQMVDKTVQLLRHNIADLVTFNNSPVDQADWERVASAVTTENEAGETVVEADLFELVRNFVAVTANPSLIGTDFVNNFPEFWQLLWMFDDSFKLLAVNLPSWIPIPKLVRARRARSAAIQCCREFEVAMETDRIGGYPGARWSDLDNVGALIQDRVDSVYRKDGMSLDQRAVCEFSLLWAMNANSNALIFWVLWRVYSDPVLLIRIREEIAPFVVPEEASAGFGTAMATARRMDKIDVDGLMTRCPLLKAAYVETLRTDVSAWSFKVIREDVVLSERDDAAAKVLLRKGTYAHAAHELHHMNPAAFEDPKDWRIDRHIDWDAQNEKGETVPAVDMGTVRPYGGGVSMCKGRQFAAKEILVFTAAILATYDMEPAGGGDWKFPSQDRSLGTRKPASSTRVWIKPRVLE